MSIIKIYNNLIYLHVNQQLPYWSHPRVAKSVAFKNPLKFMLWPWPKIGIVFGSKGGVYWELYWGVDEFTLVWAVKLFIDV